MSQIYFLRTEKYNLFARLPEKNPVLNSPRIDKETLCQFLWEGGCQSLGVGEHAVIDETCVSVELGHLGGCSSDHS